MKRLLFFIYSLFVPVYFISAGAYKTQSLTEDIGTLQVHANSNWMSIPVIDINSNEFIRINFDRLGENTYETLRYRLVYCNADWTKASLADVEVFSGFNDGIIDDYAHSVNTTVEYVNYNLEIPNDRMRPKISGNYVIEVYEEGKTNNILLTACFSIVEPLIHISGTVSSRTDIDVNKEHQQVSFVIDYGNLPVRDAFSDLKVFVKQNSRLDNQKAFVKPTYVQANKLRYENNRELIFEAGNEYRRFESVSYRYNGLNMDFTAYRKPYYDAYILLGKVRSEKRYVYDQDQNGRFYIRNAEARDSDIEADYFVTYFRLQTEDIFLQPVYLNGDFTYSTFSDKYKMTYDSDKKEYVASVLLKQGAYNYQYLANTTSGYSTSVVEGNYYETKNEYHVFVYYRPLGERADYLIGILLLNND